MRYNRRWSTFLSVIGTRTIGEGVEQYCLKNKNNNKKKKKKKKTLNAGIKWQT